MLAHKAGSDGQNDEYSTAVQNGKVYAFENIRACLHLRDGMTACNHGICRGFLVHPYHIYPSFFSIMHLLPLGLTYLWI